MTHEDYRRTGIQSLTLTSLNSLGLAPACADPPRCPACLLFMVHTLAGGGGAEFSGLEFSGAEFSGLDLSELEFSALNLSGIEFGELNLSGIEVSGLHLSGLEFSGLDRQL